MLRRLNLLVSILLCLGISSALTAFTMRTPAIWNPHAAATTPMGSAQTVTLQILALRVEFLADEVKTTTGNGRFDLSTQSEYSLDRPPHNRTYFQDQLLALHTYFSRISGGRLSLQAEVFPSAETSAYQLAHDMVHYSGQENAALQEKRRAELLRDAITAAAADPEIDFSKYDYVIVFHAGVGQDFAFDFDTSPFDIQSVYIDFSALRAALAENETFPGIPCPGGVHVREGIILPETQNQEGLTLGLLGSMTLLFGSQIGMPNLFDTESGRAGIGRWGLMDQGSYNFQGFIPAHPSAWEKLHMGWEEPVVVQTAANVRIGSFSTTSAPHLIKVPISAKEYFLIENRQRDPNHDKITIGRDRQGRRAEFDSTGRVVAPADIGVLISIDEYDYGLPGSGLLIWHIDERVIETRLADNTINNDRDHRGVDLVECDGAQDIGYLYSMFDYGYGTENGDYWDPYWAGNESHLYVNEAPQVAFSPRSIPSSDGHGGVKTHITIKHISGLDTVMTASIASDLLVEGFPRLEAAGQAFNHAALLAIPSLNGLPGHLFAATAAGKVYAWRGDGNALSPFSGYELTPVNGLSLPLLYANLDGDNTYEVIAVDEAQGITLYHLLPTGVSAEKALFEGALRTAAMILPRGGGAADPALVTGNSNGTLELFICPGPGTPLQKNTSYSLASAAVTRLAWFPQNGAELIVLSADQTLRACNLSAGALLWHATVPAGVATPLVADFDGDGQLEVALVYDSGRIQLYSANGQLLHDHKPLQLLHDITAPALGDIDRDGLPEILCNSREGFFAFERNGAAVLNFPAATYTADSVSATVGALFARHKKGGSAVAIAPATDGRIMAYDHTGSRLPRFPLSGDAPLVTTPVLADLQGKGYLNLAALNQDGVLLMWNLALPEIEYQVWGQYGGEGRTFHLEPAAITPPDASDLLPARRVFCYPNPVSYGSTTIRFTLTQACEQMRIRIYDLAANFVQELTATALTAGEHEIPWSIAAIHSGVYLARVEAQSGSHSATQIIKIAVTK